MKQLTVIGRATEYVAEYIKNGFQQAAAYQSVFNCDRQNAISHASVYHKSPAVQDAFENLIGSSIQEYYKHRDGITLKAQELYDQAKDAKTRLAVLRFIAELAGHLKQDLNIDARQINVTLSKDKELEIVNKLKKIGTNTV